MVAQCFADCEFAGVSSPDHGAQGAVGPKTGSGQIERNSERARLTLGGDSFGRHLFEKQRSKRREPGVASQLIDADSELERNPSELIFCVCQLDSGELTSADDRAPETKHRQVHVQCVKQTVQRSRAVAPWRIVILPINRIFAPFFKKSSVLLDVEKAVVMKFVNQSGRQFVAIAWHT